MAAGCSLRLLPLLVLAVSASSSLSPAQARRVPASNDRRMRLDGPPLPYLWPLPKQFRHGNATLSVDPNILFHPHGDGGNSSILGEALQRYRSVIFGYRTRLPATPTFDLSRLTVVVSSGDETLRLGVDESYTLMIAKGDDRSIIGEATIEYSRGGLWGRWTFTPRKVVNCAMCILTCKASFSHPSRLLVLTYLTAQFSAQINAGHM